MPFRPVQRASGDQPGWQTVRKRRRISRFPMTSGRIEARVPGPAGEPVCAVELTEIHARGRAWWSPGFEATGAPDLLRGALDRAAALVLAHALPGGAVLGTDESKSYSEWLRPRPDAGSEAGA